jgi:hypothetical protein
MLSFFIGGEKKARGRHEELKRGARLKNAKELFFSGKFPVVTTPVIKGRRIRKVLGLVSGRGFDSECAFYGLTASALYIGADASSAIRKTWLPSRRLRIFLFTARP